MTTTNDITGDALVSKQATDAYRDGWDRIFGKKNVPAPIQYTDIDADRLRQSLESESHDMPPNLTRDEKRQRILDVAKGSTDA